MQHRVTTWSAYWGSRTEHQHPCSGLATLRKASLDAIRNGLCPEEIRPEELVDPIRASPSKAAPGADEWRVHQWNKAPKEALEWLAEILNQAEQSRKWPKQVLTNLVAFIGKPTVIPSERPITLTCSLYRLYCKVRKPAVESWEEEKHGFWDTAIKGSSALQVGLVRELRHELAAGLGSTTGGLYFDL